MADPSSPADRMTQAEADALQAEAEAKSRAVIKEIQDGSLQGQIARLEARVRALEERVRALEVRQERGAVYLGSPNSASNLCNIGVRHGPHADPAGHFCGGIP